LGAVDCGSWNCRKDWLHPTDFEGLGSAGGTRYGGTDGAFSAERDRIAGLERELRQLRQANETFRKMKEAERQTLKWVG
jgi:hypothetical protein